METGVHGVLGPHVLQNALLFEGENVTNQFHSMAEKLAMGWPSRRALVLHIVVSCKLYLRCFLLV